MRATSGRMVAYLAAAFVALAAFTARADEALYTSKLEKVRAWQRSELASLAGLARARGYNTLVRRCVGQAVALGAKPEEVTPPDLPPEDGDELALKRRAGLHKKELQYHQDAARRLGALARWCTRSDLENKADTLAREALRHDPDAKDAHTVVGEMPVPGWGWMSAVDAKQVRQGLLPLGRDWKKAADVEKARSAWDQAWHVLSPNWSIRSNLPLERVFAARDLLEEFHTRWMQDWDGYLPLEPHTPRHQVFIFRTKAEYDALVEERVPNYTRNVPGQYSHVVRGAFFYDVETHRGGGNDTSSLEELMLHECAHQLFHELVKGHDANTTQGNPANFWLHEGIGEFYGMLSRGKTGLAYDPGHVKNLVRTKFLKQHLGAVASLEQLDGMLKDAFQSPDGNQRLVHYAQSGFLCAFLETGGRRNVLRRAVRDVYTGRNDPGLLSRLLGDDLAKAQKRYEAFLAGL